MDQQTEKLPEWTTEEKQKMMEKMVELTQKLPNEHPLVPVEQTPVTNFTTFFADWEIRGQDMIVHLYPRAGASDEWTAGHYEPYCKSCGSRVEVKSRKDLKPCPRCGHTGLRYIPSRTERPPENAVFPSDMKDKIKRAADGVWMGDVAIDSVPELKAYVVQFQRVLVTAKTVGFDIFVDKFCAKVDQELDLK